MKQIIDVTKHIMEWAPLIYAKTTCLDCHVTKFM